MESNAGNGIFERYELKYLLDGGSCSSVASRLGGFMDADRYGKYTVSNIYFDTRDHALIRASLEKPVYKEKLRLRCYGMPEEEKTVFAEIKKKYNGVVYKRRIPMLLKDARRYLYYGIRPETEKTEFTERQIFNEINYMKEFYDLRPAAFIAYDRTAFSGKEDPELRITFDRNIRGRDYALELTDTADCSRILPRDRVLMEIKTGSAMPLWLCRILEPYGACRTSFSKYGEFYQMAEAEKEKAEGGQICA